MMGGGRFFNGGDDTKKEEAEGRQIWERLQSKEIDCQKLTDNQFEALGEYFMGIIAGENHQLMNQMMTRMMGISGEKEAHVVLGKIKSGCDKNARPSAGWSWMPMMGNWPMMGGGWGMMGGYGGLFFGWYWLVVQLLVLAILVLLVFICGRK